MRRTNMVAAAVAALVLALPGVARKIDYRIEKLDVRVYGDTAVSTFERIGTVKDLEGTTRDSHLRISGVWVRLDGQWKLAHRHESRC